jgi:hypothetical protein
VTISPRSCKQQRSGEAWLETVRETQALDLQASNEMPGDSLERHSMRYQAFVTVTGGIDLELMSADNFEIDGDSLTITLPQAQLRDCTLDIASSNYYDRNCRNAGCGNLEAVLIEVALEAAATQETERLLQEAYEEAVAYMQDLSFISSFEVVTIQRSSEVLGPVATGGTCFASPTPPPRSTP